MEYYHQLVNWIGFNLIRLLPSMIVSLMLISYFFKPKEYVQPGYKLVKWIIIVFTSLLIIGLLGEFLYYLENREIYTRAIGEYRSIHVFMFISAIFLPLSLFYKKLANKPFYLLFISIMMKIGEYFESYVIVLTTYARDMNLEGVKSDWFILFQQRFLEKWIQGIIFAIISLAVIYFVKKKISLKT